MHTRRADVLLCVAVVVALTVVVSSDQGRGGPVNPLAYLWALGLGALMLIRRPYPRLVLVLTALGFFSYHAVGFPALGVAVPIAAALYSATEMGYLRAACATGAVTLGGATLYRLLAGQDLALILGFELVSHGALIAAVIALGHSVRTSRRLRWRTEQVTRLLERQSAMDADARTREDRLNLARELHDSIGHALSVASLYTDVAREAETDPDRRREALELARRGISDSLTHLRRTVAVLRGSGRASEGSDPGLRDLEDLLRGPRAAGYRVDLELAGVSAPPEVEAAAFRVVQEAVTNSLRHSNGTALRVSVRTEPPGDLVICVADDGRASAAPGAEGHGLRGMRERVTDLGGHLDAGPTPNGWTVRAAIPLGAPT